MTSLDSLQRGQSGEIVRIAGSDSIACRLREMGFVPGERVRVLSVAPLGDPLACEIQGSHVALRRLEANRITVAVSDSPASPAIDTIHR